MAEIKYDGKGCVVDLNRDSVEELSKVPEIGSLAQRIVDYRDEHGPFTSLDDLDNVPGVDKGVKHALRYKVVRFD